MRIVSHGSPKSHKRKGALELVSLIRDVRAALLAYLKVEANMTSAVSREREKAVERLTNAYLALDAGVVACSREMLEHADASFAHGVAVGLWRAGRPELIRDLDETITRHMWSLPCLDREMIKHLQGR